MNDSISDAPPSGKRTSDGTATLERRVRLYSLHRLIAAINEAKEALEELSDERLRGLDDRGDLSKAVGVAQFAIEMIGGMSTEPERDHARLLAMHEARYALSALGDRRRMAHERVRLALEDEADPDREPNDDLWLAKLCWGLDMCDSAFSQLEPQYAQRLCEELRPSTDGKKDPHGAWWLLAILSAECGALGVPRLPRGAARKQAAELAKNLRKTAKAKEDEPGKKSRGRPPKRLG